ncbi:MAG: putative ABC transport system permease protein [Phenylobacterium sp.]|jgi:putative ABC transport system permease protein
MFEIRPIFSAMLRHKSRAVLIILQMALTLAIVANALFIINERLTLIQRDSGFAESTILGFRTVTLKTNDNIYQQIDLDEQMLRAIPGVIDALAISSLPLSGSGSATSISSKPSDPEGQMSAGYYNGDEHILNTMGVELIEGRNFNKSDVVHGSVGMTSVVIINQSLANKLYPDGDALGKNIYDDLESSKIIGIVGVMQGMWVNASLFEDNMIFPFVDGGNSTRYMVRTEPGMKAAVTAQVEEKMAALNSDRVIGEFTTLTKERETSYKDDSAMAKILSAIVVLLLSVTVVGIFGLSAFSVNQRIKQIGTRRALGASKLDITRYFLIENGLMAVAGISIGCVLALALNYWLVNAYGVTQLNITYVIATMVGIFIVSQLAVLIPALKAAQVSPAVATR